MDDDLQASSDAILAALRGGGGTTDQEGWERIYSTVPEADTALKHLLEQGTLFYDGHGVLRMRHPGVVNVTGDPVDAVSGILSLDVSVDEAIRAMRGGAEGNL